MDDAAVAKFFRLDIDEAILVLLTITHPSIEPIRVVNNAPAEDGANDIVSRGETFIAFPFTLELPGDTEEEPTARIRIANVPYEDDAGNDRRVSDSLRALTSPPEMAMEIIRSSDPDTVLRRFARFELRTATADAIEVSGELGQAAYGSEPYPNIRVVPSLIPSLFR